jgi:UDP-N-acetylmuramoyl-L-alanyl-D-glutamate--2,6-diaminopimelate ligase
LVNGVAFEALSEIAVNLKPVCGRMDAAIIPNQPLVVVDYSHTPDALEKALLTLNELKGNGKLICVFGCGGNRDRSKRPLMGKVAVLLADHCIITSDNPRFEDPKAIIREISADLPAGSYQVISDRKEAIIAAISGASSNDVVLIAGKGHETYQEIQGVKHHFSDLEVVRELLNVDEV